MQGHTYWKNCHVSVLYLFIYLMLLEPRWLCFIMVMQCHSPLNIFYISISVIIIRQRNHFKEVHTCRCDKCLSFLDVGVRRWTKQNKQSLDGNYAPCMNSHSKLVEATQPCTIMEVDWRTHFLRELIINYRLSGKVGRVQISWIPVTSQTDWWLPDSGCWWCVKCGWCVLEPVDVLRVETCHLCQHTEERLYLALSPSQSHLHRQQSVWVQVVLQSLSALSGLKFNKWTTPRWDTIVLRWYRAELEIQYTTSKNMTVVLISTCNLKVIWLTSKWVWSFLRSLIIPHWKSLLHF